MSKPSARYAVKLFMAALALICGSFSVQAQQPLSKIGSCPSGYHTSGNYCTPGSSARFALPKVGACPSGYSTSGDYCLAGSNARLALPKAGSCPSGYSTSGDYCLSSK